MIRPDAIWKYNTGTATYTDLSTYTNTDTAFNFISTTDEVFLIGFSRRFVGLIVELSTNGSYTGLTYEIFDGGSWKACALQDTTYTFNSTKYVRWVLPNLWGKKEATSTWPYTASAPDAVERYWLRVTVTGVTTTAVVSKLRLIPYVMYTTPTKVNKFLMFKKPFDSSTTPSDLDVEDFIRRAEDRIDYRTRKSWRFNAVTEDYQPILTEFNRYGFYVRHRNFYKVYSVEIWTGNEWSTLTEGRNSDYFVNYNTGLIYFTRLYIIPAAYGMSGRYFYWGFGEYKESVRVYYAYGRNWESDPEFRIIEDVATKLAAKEIIKNIDYTNFIVGGTNAVTMENKARLYEEEAEQRLDELTGVAMY
jgi:hypothetical protein